MAATTFPGGARYVWGGLSHRVGVVEAWFGGYLAAGALDRPALTWRPDGGPLVVVVPGTKQVRLSAGDPARTVTAGLLDEHPPTGTVQVRDANGTQLPVKDVRTLPPAR